MSVQVIDYFEFPSVSTPGLEIYIVSFDDETLAITVSYTGNDGEASSVSPTDRGKTLGTTLWQVCDITTPTTQNTVAASYSTPFAYLSQEVDSPACTPQPDTCNLAFSSIDFTPETEQGGNDGTITALATSAFTGIEYSINGIDWQSSGEFTGLAPGNYSVFARDDNECLISQVVTIDSYYNPIIGGFNGLPIVQVSSGNISRWSAAYNPIVINFQRRDFLVTAVAEGPGGQIEVTLNQELDSAEIALALSSNVTIISTKYNFATPALSHSVDGGFSVLTFSNIFYGTDTGIVIIDLVKPNFKIEIEITAGTDQYSKVVITGNWSPNLLGVTRADMSAYLQSLVNADDDFTYDVLNYRDLNRSASYTLRYREVWDTGSSAWYVAPYPLYVVYAAMQLGDPRGGNMADYVPFYNEPNPDLKAKFMTAFPEPYFNVGLPFDLSFIYSEYLVNTMLYMRTTSLDINRNIISGSAVDSLLLNTDAGYLMADDDSRFLIQRGALPPVQDDGVTDYLGVNRLMMAGNPADLVHFYQIQLFRGTSESPVFVTQPLIVRTIRPCANDNYVYVKWINNLGGWDYFRFGFNQVLQLSTQNDTVVNRNVFNWATDNTIADVIKKSGNKKYTFGVNDFEASQISGLEQIATSPKVQMLIRENPIYWQTVIITPGSFNLYETRKGLGNLSFTAQLVDINIQRQ
jgi:hypothetical protein